MAIIQLDSKEFKSAKNNKILLSIEKDQRTISLIYYKLLIQLTDLNFKTITELKFRLTENDLIHLRDFISTSLKNK